MALNPRPSGADKVKAVLTLALALTAAGLFIVFLGGVRFWEDLDTYVIRFGSVRDLAAGRPVKYGGLDIGRVEEIDVDPADPTKITVTIGVREHFPIHRGTQAAISQKGLVGDNYVYLEIVGEPGPVLPVGSAIPAREIYTVNDVAQKVGEILQTLAPRLDAAAEGLALLLNGDSARDLSATLKALPGLVAEINGTVTTFRKDFGHLAGSIERNADLGARSVERMQTDLSKSLEAFTTTLGTLQGELAATLSVYREQGNATLAEVGQTAASVRGDLAVNQALLAETLANANRLAEEMRRLVSSLRDRPWQVFGKPQGEDIP